MATVGAFTHIVIAGTFFFRSGFFSLEGDVIVWVPATFFVWILVAGVTCTERLRQTRPSPAGSGLLCSAS